MSTHGRGGKTLVIRWTGLPSGVPDQRELERTSVVASNPHRSFRREGFEVYQAWPYAGDSEVLDVVVEVGRSEPSTGTT
jgi:hypothetical protein